MDGQRAKHYLVPPTHLLLALQINPNVILPITFSKHTLISLLEPIY